MSIAYTTPQYSVIFSIFSLTQTNKQTNRLLNAEKIILIYCVLPLLLLERRKLDDLRKPLPKNSSSFLVLIRMWFGGGCTAQKLLKVSGLFFEDVGLRWKGEPGLDCMIGYLNMTHNNQFWSKYILCYFRAYLTTILRTLALISYHYFEKL